MKRILSLFLVIFMLCCASVAAAESGSPYGRVSKMSGEVMPYESVSGLFFMEIPNDYIALDSVVFQEITSAISSMDADEFQSFYNLDYEAASALFSSIDPALIAGCDYIFAPDLVGNMNVISTPDLGITQDALAAFNDVLIPQLTAQYVSLGAAEESCIGLGVVTYGNNDYIGFSVELVVGTPTYQYITANANGDMIVFSFGGITEEVIASILESVIIY